MCVPSSGIAAPVLGKHQTSDHVIVMRHDSNSHSQRLAGIPPRETCKASQRHMPMRHPQDLLIGNKRNFSNIDMILCSVYRAYYT
jgi:hypothetical protein